MHSNLLLDFSWWGLALQLVGAIAITAFVAAALVSLSLGRGVLRARLLAAEGVIGGLGLMTAATLLRTIGLRTWHQILMFTLVLSLRILLKKLFVWEKQRLFAGGRFSSPSSSSRITSSSRRSAEITGRRP
jgi:hypothetical protein